MISFIYLRTLIHTFTLRFDSYMSANTHELLGQVAEIQHLLSSTIFRTFAACTLLVSVECAQRS
jgi:hypothetical protein